MAGLPTRRGRTTSLLREVPGFSADFRESSYHDLVARLETFIDLTDTRLTPTTA